MCRFHLFTLRDILLFSITMPSFFDHKIISTNNQFYLINNPVGKFGHF